MNLFAFADIWTRVCTYALTRCVEISFRSIGSGEIIFYAEGLKTNMSKTFTVSAKTLDQLEHPAKVLEVELMSIIDKVR